MRISKISIENFRNFRDFTVDLGEHAVIVGENKIGKSNLLYALRLILDPSLPDSARQLRRDDFWDGHDELDSSVEIRIAVEFSDFADSLDQLAILGDYLCQPDPMVARLTYVFQCLPELDGEPTKDADYHYFIFGGDEEDRLITTEPRRRLPLELLPALRDPESALASRSRSPLSALLDRAISLVDDERRGELAEAISEATDQVGEIEEISDLAETVATGFRDMVGDGNAIDLEFGFTSTNSERLFRGLKLFIDGRKRLITEASLGSANALFLSLKVLELNLLAEENVRDHTFLAIEEPESHLHPQLQRLVYRRFLQTRNHQPDADNGSDAVDSMTKLMTTHSPHVVSVSPLECLVLLRKNQFDGSTVGVSTVNIDLVPRDIDDLERYLEVNRGEIVFAKGVLLVEGPSEEYVVTALAQRLEKDLDRQGIVVCSVDGTNFSPFVKLLGEGGLDIPFAILTDYDPNKENDALSIQRVESLLLEIDPSMDVESLGEEELFAQGEEYGIFVNDHTFEISLFDSGRRKLICGSVSELTDNQKIKERMGSWKEAPDTLDPKRFLKDINTVSKGRLGQRMATKILKSSNANCPRYIKNAIDYLIGEI